MELIQYPEAASILSVKMNTINQAIERGVLTRAGRNGRNMLLLKEQVMLFTGNNVHTGNPKRLSLASLSSSEYKQWQRLQTEAFASFAASAEREKKEYLATLFAEGEAEKARIRAMVREEINHELAPIVQEITDLDREEEQKKHELAAIQGQKEGYRKALSVLRRRAEHQTSAAS